MSRKIKKQKQPESTASQRQSDSGKKTRRLVIIIVSALVGAAIILGIVLGIVLAVRNASYVMYVDGVGIDEGVTNYLASYYKAKYKAILADSLGAGGNVVDTKAFWSQKVHPDVATTYADYLRIYVETNIKYVVIANSIFDSGAKLDYEDRAEIAVATQEILNYRHSGDVDTFNEEAAKYGFDFDDFVTATEMLYKSNFAITKLFGSNGEGIASDTAFCEEFYSGYARVSFLFIRTENTYVYDDEGNPVIGDDNKYTTRELSADERAERLADIEKLQGIIDGKYELALYEDIWLKYQKENNVELYDCYLTDGSAFETELSAKYSAFTDAALGLEVYELGRVDDSSSDDGNSFIGSGFIYRNECEESAYLGKDEYGYFDDFYALVANKRFSEMVESLESELEIRDKWSLVDLVSLPYNDTYIVRGF